MPEFKSNLSKTEVKDPLTNELFIPKRFNQRFSCRANQITFNNNKARAIRQKTLFVNKPLQKNFKILEELIVNKKEITVHKQFLIGKGFYFGVHTHVKEYEGNNQYAIYNYT